MDLHTKKFSNVIEENLVAQDAGFGGATLLAYCRRVLDKKGFYSTSAINKYLIEVDRSFGTCAFDIAVDIKNNKVILEAEIIDTAKAFIDEIVDIVNEMNNDLLHGFCLVIEDKVVYTMTDSYGGYYNDMAVGDIANRLIENFIDDYLEIMQGGYCDMVSIIEKDFFSKV